MLRNTQLLLILNQGEAVVSLQIKTTLKHQEVVTQLKLPQRMKYTGT